MKQAQNTAARKEAVMLKMLLILLAILPVGGSAEAKQQILQHEKCDGKVASYSAGVADRSIGSGDSMCYFVSGSEIGKRILRTCPIGSECHVVATVKNDAAGGDWSPIIIALIEVTNLGMQSSIDQDVLSINSDLAEMCSGWPGDDPHIGEVCAVRLKVEKLLGSLGYCFGKQGQSRAELVWHKCTAQSSYRP